MVLQVLSENAELSSRLIDVALTSDNDIFEAAFGDDVGSNGNGMATMPLGHWSQEATQKRREEAQEEVCSWTCMLTLYCAHTSMTLVAHKMLQCCILCIRTELLKGCQLPRGRPCTCCLMRAVSTILLTCSGLPTDPGGRTAAGRSPAAAH